MLKFSIPLKDKTLQVNVICIRNSTGLNKLLDDIPQIENTLQATIVVTRKELGLFKRFLQIACTNAVKSHYRNEKRIAKKLSIEIIVNLAGTRQIGEAINKIVPYGKKEGIVIIVAENTKKHQTVVKFLEGKVNYIGPCQELDENKNKLVQVMSKLYAISKEELEATYAKNLAEALEKCLISRTATIYI